MFPFSYYGYGFRPMPYWYNYYYYFYKYPRMSYLDEDEDEYEEGHRNADTEAIEAARESNDCGCMKEKEEDETIQPPEQFGRGNSGFFPPGMPPVESAATPNEIISLFEKNQPDILGTITSYGVPLNDARQIIGKTVEVSITHTK